jgi:hypothetical protein
VQVSKWGPGPQNVSLQVKIRVNLCGISLNIQLTTYITHLGVELVVFFKNHTPYSKNSVIFTHSSKIFLGWQTPVEWLEPLALASISINKTF